MEIFPRDLGTENYLTVLRRRLSPVTGTVHSGAVHYRASVPGGIAAAPREAKPLRNRRLRRYWTRGLNLNEAEAEKVGSLVWNSATGMSARVVSIIFSVYLGIFTVATLASGALPVTLILLLLWAALVAGMLQSPRPALRKAHQRSLDMMEIEALLPTARGRLETSYLNLVRDARQTEVASAAAQEDIREALRALGNTIARLPAEPVRPQDAVAVAQSARALRDQAAQEADSVVRDSLLRQASTQEKQIASANESAKAARRVQALRREVRVQMDSLRSALLTFNDSALTAHQTGAATLALSDAMQQVAEEARAVSLARQELAEQELLGLIGPQTPQMQQTLPQGALTQPPPVSKPLLTPQSPQQEAPPQQQVGQTGSGRQWWRSG